MKEKTFKIHMNGIDDDNEDDLEHSSHNNL